MDISEKKNIAITVLKTINELIFRFTAIHLERNMIIHIHKLGKKRYLYLYEKFRMVSKH